MYCRQRFDVMTREELCSAVCELSDNNIRLETINKSLIKYKYICDRFVQLYKFFDIFDDTFLSERVLKVKNEIKQFVALNGNDCSVEIVRLIADESQTKDNSSDDSERGITEVIEDAIELTSDDDQSSSSSDSEQTIVTVKEIPQESEPNEDEKQSDHESTEDKTIERFECLATDCGKCFGSFPAVRCHAMRKHRMNLKKEDFTEITAEDNERTAAEVSDDEQVSDCETIIEDNEENSAEEVKPIACDWIGCDKRFETQRNMKIHRAHAHRKKVQEVRPKSVAVKPCEVRSDAMFRLNWKNNEQKNELMVDMTEEEEDNNEEVEFVCDVRGCDFVAKQLDDLKKHRFTHLRDTIFKCDQCFKCYDTYEMLATHVKRNHQDYYKQVSTMAKVKQLASWKSANQNRQRSIERANCPMKKKHHAKRGERCCEKRFTCFFCRKIFRTLESLKNHENLHKPKRIICDYKGCDQRFSTVFALNLHKFCH